MEGAEESPDLGIDAGGKFPERKASSFTDGLLPPPPSAPAWPPPPAADGRGIRVPPGSAKRKYRDRGWRAAVRPRHPDACPKNAIFERPLPATRHECWMKIRSAHKDPLPRSTARGREGR